MKFGNVSSLKKSVLVICLVHLIYFQVCYCSSSQVIYTNEFAIKVTGGDKAANELASNHKFINRGQIGSLQGYYLFEHSRIRKRSINHSETHLELLRNHPLVLWVEQQHVKHRVKRDLSEEGLPYMEYPDPLYPDQWFLHHGGDGGYDMNVLPVWTEGYTGKGVVVSILDDGVQTNHPDLVQNYDKLASRDINGQDDDPTPQDNGDNNHGTRCAGEVAAVAFNDFCGIGVAYNASIGGVRMLDGTVTDATEAAALSHNPNHIHIYSASWGPEDDGKKVDGPGRLAKAAFLEGITKGRSGLGSIFVWASGNGGRNSDSCNCDGYTNSIYTLSISSATQRGTMPWYLEQCSSTLATTYSSGTSSRDKNIATVDVDNSYLNAIANDQPADSSRLCTKSHTGTSASAPIAAGICALALEANPKLTWRDMQYLVLITSRYEPLKNEKGWVKNGVNRFVSSKFGYGLMDAAAMVKLAKRWTSVPEQHICETMSDISQRIIPSVSGEHLEVSMNTTGCKNMLNSVIYLEHVQVKVTLYFKPRGNLKIVLISPAGTKSTVLLPRSHDLQEGSFNDWPFMSVHFWGEKCEGTWKLLIINNAAVPVHQPGKLMQWSLIFYGTSSWPINLTEEKRTEHRSPRLHSLSYEYMQDELFNVEDELLNRCFQSKKYKFRTEDIISCVDKCPAGFYADLITNLCITCNKSCATCFGPSDDTCLSCSEKFYLSKNFCEKSCQDGFYADSSKWECLPCSQSCLTCSEANSCQSCKPDYFPYKHKCVPTCPRNAFLDKNVCLNCHPDCASCYGESSFECLDCLSGSYMFNFTCMTDCPIGFYPNEYQVCSRCPQTCKTCTGDRMCSSCYDELILRGGECLIPKTDNGCLNKKLEYCSHDSCSSNCSLCGIDHCIQCKKGYYWSGDECTELCPKGFFSRGGDCHRCPHMCQNCADHYGACTVCDNNLILHHKNCLSFCPRGFRLNDANVCEPCDSSCARCKGGTAYDCTLCRHGYFLLHNTCLTSCPDGYFADMESVECLPCYHMCKTCSSSGRFGCTNCHNYSQFMDGLCIPCLDNEYLDSNTCFECHSKCEKCDGPTEFNCLSCPKPLNLNQVNHSCLPCCRDDLPKDENCCSCSKVSGICINSVEHPRSIGFNFEGDLYEVVIPMNHVVVIIAAICASAVVLFIVLFGILQAHTYGWCNFGYTHGDYKRVPNNLAAHLDAEMESVSLTQGDPDEEDDIYEKA